MCLRLHALAVEVWNVQFSTQYDKIRERKLSWCKTCLENTIIGWGNFRIPNACNFTIYQREFFLIKDFVISGLIK